MISVLIAITVIIKHVLYKANFLSLTKKARYKVDLLCLLKY